MKKDWEIVKLGEICDVRDGTHDSPKYVMEGFPLITSKNIINGTINFENVNLISKIDLEKINKRSLVEDGDIIMPMIGTIGNPIIVKKEREFGIKNVALIKFKNNTKINNRYLCYALDNVETKNQIESEAKGVAQKYVSLSFIRNLSIPLPPLPIQKKIADILDKADALRRADKELLQKYDQLAQAIFIDMFGDPEFNTKNFVQTEMGKEVQFIGGSQPPKSTFSYRLHENYIRLIQIRDYKSDRFLTYIPKDKARRFCTKDDIMIGRYGPPVFQILRGLEGAYNVALMKAVPGSKIGKEFLFSLLSSAYLQNIIIGNSQRTAGQTGVNLEILEKIKIFLPPMELQQKFEKRVSLIHKLHRLQNNILIQSETAFNSLIQKAFAGELE